MITRIHRFHGHGSLRFVYQKGSSVYGGACSLRFIHNPRRKTWRLSVVISRKVHKSAVVRNRIRRRLYEIARVQLAEVALPYDVVITVHSEKLAAVEAAELSALLTGLFAKAGITGSR